MKMKKTLYLLLLTFMGLVSCTTHKDNIVIQPSQIQTTQAVKNLQDVGFDLQALPELLEKSKDPASLEKMINKTGSINNVDLDKNDTTDYIFVNEGTDSHGNKTLSFVDNVPIDHKPSSTILVTATITQNADHQNANVNVTGNSSYYNEGQQSYNSTISIRDIVLLSYLLSYHQPYHSLFGYGHYPRYYSYQRRVSPTAYSTTVTKYRTVPVKNVSPPPVRPNLSNPTASKKSYEVRDVDKKVAAGGFGQKIDQPKAKTPDKPIQKVSAPTKISAPKSSGIKMGSSRGSSSRGGGGRHR